MHDVYIIIRLYVKENFKTEPVMSFLFVSHDFTFLVFNRKVTIESPPYIVNIKLN